jgi:hypothetical protein
MGVQIIFWGSKRLYILKITAISEKVKYNGNPCTYLLSKGPLEGDPLLLLLPSPQCQIIYLFFIRDRFSGEQLNFVCVCLAS